MAPYGWVPRMISLLLLLGLGNWAIWKGSWPLSPRDPNDRLEIALIAFSIAFVVFADWLGDKLEARGASKELHLGRSHRASQESLFSQILDRGKQVLVWAGGGGVVGLVLILAVTNGQSRGILVVGALAGVTVGATLGLIGDGRGRVLKGFCVLSVPLGVLITGFLMVDIRPLIDSASTSTIGALGIALVGIVLLILLIKAARLEGLEPKEALCSRPANLGTTRRTPGRLSPMRRIVCPGLCFFLAVTVAVVGGGDALGGSMLLLGYVSLVVFLAILLGQLLAYLMYGAFFFPTLASIDAIQDLIVTVVFAVVIAWGVQQFVAKPYRVPSGSMEKTIQIGERIIAKRADWLAGSPSRKQIIVFNPNGSGSDVYDTTSASSETFVKRLVGLPGETIGAIDGHVYVCSGQGPVEGGSITMTPGCRFLEEPYVSSVQDDFGPIMIPRARYFMMGDNRANSDDSRNWGPITQGQMIGPALITYWPVSRIGETGRPPLFAGFHVPTERIPGGWRLFMSAIFSIVIFALIVLQAIALSQRRYSHE